MSEAPHGLRGHVTGPKRTPEEALDQTLRDIRESATQGAWDERMDDPDFRQALLEGDPDWFFVGGRIQTKARLCDECLAQGGSKYRTHECPGQWWTLAVPETVEHKRLTLQVTPCSFIEDKKATHAREDWLKGLNLSDAKKDEWTFVMAAPRDTSGNVDAAGRNELARALCEASGYYKSPSDHWLYLYSRRHGTGKTRIAVATALQWLEKGKEARYVNFPTLYAQFKGQLGAGREGDEADDAHWLAHTLLPKVAEFPSLLVLDDLGKEIPTPRTLEWLYIILNTRYERDLPLILTSNYDPGHLYDYYAGTDAGYAEAIVSRIIGKVGEPDPAHGVPLEATYQLPLEHQKDNRRDKRPWQQKAREGMDDRDA